MTLLKLSNGDYINPRRVLALTRSLPIKGTMIVFESGYRLHIKSQSRDEVARQIEPSLQALHEVAQGERPARGTVKEGES